MTPPLYSPSASTASLAVVICSHNPCLAVLDRVLSALRKQTLPASAYSLLIVDNASAPPIPDDCVNWHPGGRIVREANLGLTHARLRGIKETSSELIVFVDDDNLLDPDYLEAALEISRSNPLIGAFAGSAIPEFEVTPPESIRPYIQYLACTTEEPISDTWSNFHSKHSIPSGAGLCVRRAVAQRYLAEIGHDPIRTALGRSGTTLSSGEDHDLALTTTDMNLGMGRFRKLRLTHVIARRRLTEDYIIRLYAGIGQCTKVLEAIRPHYRRPRSKLEQLRFVWHLLRGPQFERRILWARLKAEREANKVIAKFAALGSSQHIDRD